jgi:hypothetical protein
MSRRLHRHVGDTVRIKRGYNRRRKLYGLDELTCMCGNTVSPGLKRMGYDAMSKAGTLQS